MLLFNNTEFPSLSLFKCFLFIDSILLVSHGCLLKTMPWGGGLGMYAFNTSHREAEDL